jgi:light-regulated signal transduction histidine kinase (bacteriophytochrome)
MFNAQRKLIGLLAVVHDRPLSEDDESKSIVAIFAARAGAELERIHAEQQILQLNTELEQRVRERTGQLLAANQEMQAFSYSVSHDLRAPLRHIAGFTNLLERNPAVMANAEAQRHASVINVAARKMGQLIDDLLIFSRMGRQEMKRQSIDLNVLVDECLRDLQPDMEGRRIEWKRGALPAVVADAAMLRQVWLNLLSNAVKYSRRCDPSIIEMGGQEIGDQFVFAVKDNGAGFDMKYAEKLFGVFQRLHRDEDFEGTGIGLANVRRIVHRHGGHTWAIGAIDQGATFYFSLPKTPVETDLFAAFPAIPVPPSEQE